MCISETKTFKHVFSVVNVGLSNKMFVSLAKSKDASSEESGAGESNFYFFHFH